MTHDWLITHVCLLLPPAPACYCQVEKKGLLATKESCWSY